MGSAEKQRMFQVKLSYDNKHDLTHSESLCLLVLVSKYFFKKIVLCVYNIAKSSINTIKPVPGKMCK